MKRKDALTDLIEHTQGNQPSAPTSGSSGDRQVVNEAGEKITLGYESSAKPNKGILLEPNILKEVISKALDSVFEKLSREKNKNHE
jgi:hypothetical protein